MTRRLMLIDGNSLTYRAFHALPPELATSSGQVTNAVLGFTNMLIYLVKDHSPDGIVVAWDRKEPTFRHERIETYKANRDATPDALLSQFGIIKNILDAINICQIDKIGIEADDIIATLATTAAERQVEALIVTGDRDSYQLVSDPYIKVVYNKRGVTDYAIYDEKGIEERTGVKPDLYVPYAALRGDKSDNLPGVDGVGEKTAAKLINKYGGVEGIFADLDSQTPKLKTNLEASQENVLLNVELMELVRDVDLDLDFDEVCSMQEFDSTKVVELFDELEFKNVYKRLAEAFNAEPPPPAETIEIDQTSVAPAKLLEAVRQSTNFGYSIDSSSPHQLAVTHDGKSVLCSKLKDFSSAELSELEHLLNEAGIEAATFSFKQAHSVMAGYGYDLTQSFDILLAAYLADPAGASKYDLADLLTDYTSFEMPEVAEQAQGQLLFESDQPEGPSQVALDAACVFALSPVLDEKLKSQGMLDLYVDVEVPLARCLSKMELEGIAVDRSRLSELAKTMLEQAAALSTEVQELAGEEFNVNSTKVLQRILFEKLGLTAHKKTKTGFSTNQAALEKIKDDHPIVDKILEYREVEKLRSTYGQPLLDSVRSDGRIHARFRQTVARTGRLSSENPNLHNIPVRSEIGRQFREVFVADEAKKLLVADYNQIELRCIAHLSDDPGLVGAFLAGEDIHRATAAKMFDIDPAKVSKAQRENAKMVSYGLAYGMEAYGLSQRLQISTGEAKEFLDSYFANFPSVKAYMDSSVEEAREKGYTETLFGRKLAIPDLASSNFAVRQAAERQAMNAGIQGLAADIFKVAIINIDRELSGTAFESKLILQVHDEVILECPNEELDTVEKLVIDQMNTAFELKVPLEVNVATGQTWADAKA